MTNKWHLDEQDSTHNGEGTFLHHCVSATSASCLKLPYLAMAKAKLVVARPCFLGFWTLWLLLAFLLVVISPWRDNSPWRDSSPWPRSGMKGTSPIWCSLELFAAGSLWAHHGERARFFLVVARHGTLKMGAFWSSSPLACLLLVVVSFDNPWNDALWLGSPSSRSCLIVAS